jgi:hypothetical protein
VTVRRPTYRTCDSVTCLYDLAGKEVEKDGKAGTPYAGIVWKYGYDADRLVSATEGGQTNDSFRLFAVDREDEFVGVGQTRLGGLRIHGAACRSGIAGQQGQAFRSHGRPLAEPRAVGI